MKLEDLVGTQILVFAPRWFKNNPDNLALVVLHGVEAGGIWIETKTINETVLKKYETKILETTPVTFLPYHMFDAILSGVEKTLISESLAK